MMNSGSDESVTCCSSLAAIDLMDKFELIENFEKECATVYSRLIDSDIPDIKLLAVLKSFLQSLVPPNDINDIELAIKIINACFQLIKSSHNKDIKLLCGITIGALVHRIGDFDEWVGNFIETEQSFVRVESSTFLDKDVLSTDDLYLINGLLISLPIELLTRKISLKDVSLFDLIKPALLKTLTKSITLKALESFLTVLSKLDLGKKDYEETLIDIFNVVLNSWLDNPFHIKSVFKQLIKHSSPEFLITIVDELCALDWMKGVKYDLLSLVFMNCDGVDYTVVCDNFVDGFLEVCIDNLRSPINQKIPPLINEYLKRRTRDHPSLPPMITQTLVNALISPHHSIRKITRECVLPNLYKYYASKEISRIVNITNSLLSAVKEDDLGSLVCIWKLARGSGFDIEMNDDNLRKLKQALLDTSEELRIQAFSYLCVHLKLVADSVNEMELDLILEFLEFNSNDCSSAFRQAVIALLKRLFARLDKTLILLTKKHQVKNNHNSNLIRNFHKRFVHHAISGFFPGSSYQRRHMSLLYLALIFSFKIPDHHRLIFDTLIELIERDTFESNRQDAFNLLIDFPSEFLPGYESRETVENLFCDILGNLGKIRSNEGLGLKLKLFYRKYIAKLGWYFDLNTNVSRENLACPMADFFDQLLQILETRLSSNDIVKAVTENPFHGLLLAISNIITETEYKFPKIWQPLHEKLIKFVSKSVSLVSSVVTHSSPEGNLPDDFGVDVEDDEFIDDTQLVLQQCFKSCKEGLLVFDALIKKCPLPNGDNEENDCLTLSQLDKISNEIISLLLESRHRGSFSSASTVFNNLCFHYSKNAFLTNQLNQWCNSFIQQLHAFSYTRRSAGLPFAFLAILNNKTELLDDIMCKLLALARGDGVAQIHAYNILRVLFHDAKLNALLREHLGDAMVLCINGFSSPSFPIRNVSSMMFSTLCDKTLGIAKPIEDDKDQTTGISITDFISRFPQLFEYLNNVLYKAAQGIKEGLQHPALHALLIIFARLKPATSISSDVEACKSLILECTCSKIYKTRAMGARAFVSLTLKNDVKAFAQVLNLCELGNQNKLHGLLMILRDFVKRGAQLDEVAVYQLKEKSFIWELNPCPGTKAIMLEIIYILKFNNKVDGIDDIFQNEHTKLFKYLSSPASLPILEFQIQQHELQTQIVNLLFAYDKNVNLFQKTIQSDAIDLQVKIHLVKLFANHEILIHVLLDEKVDLMVKLECGKFIEVFDGSQEKLHEICLRMIELGGVFMQVFLLLMGLLKTKQYLSLLQPLCHSSNALQIRSTVINSLKRSTINPETQLIPLSIILDTLLVDDDEDIRYEACLLVSKFFLQKPVVASKCRRDLALEIFGIVFGRGAAVISADDINMLIDYWAGFLIDDRVSASKTTKKIILFEQEDDNSHVEAVINIQLSYLLLKSCPRQVLDRRFRQHQQLITRNEKDKSDFILFLQDYVMETLLKKALKEETIVDQQAQYETHGWLFLKDHFIY